MCIGWVKGITQATRQPNRHQLTIHHTRIDDTPHTQPSPTHRLRPPAPPPPPPLPPPVMASSGGMGRRVWPLICCFFGGRWRYAGGRKGVLGVAAVAGTGATVGIHPTDLHTPAQTHIFTYIYIHIYT